MTNGSAGLNLVIVMPVRRVVAPILEPIREIVSPEKSFAARWVGSHGLNRLGLHAARIAAADGCARLRRLQIAGLGGPEPVRTLLRDGVVVVPDFLARETFAELRREVRARVERAAKARPLPRGGRAGFRPKEPFPGGFDRFDGGTLNRFVAIDASETPRAHAFARDRELARLCAAASSYRHKQDKFWIYQTVHGDERAVPDLQKAYHRDTFHAALKVWYFLDDVEPDDGPFVYVPQSHRMTLRRYGWEHRRAIAASRPGQAERSGSFRIGAEELASLGLPAPRAYPVRENTLIMADVRGFHRRGDARPGATRLALHASLRPWPFAPLPY
jgi:hypothetical protein